MLLESTSVNELPVRTSQVGREEDIGVEGCEEGVELEGGGWGKDGEGT